MTGLIIDIILAAIFAVCIGYGYKKGFMRAAYQILSLIITIVIVFAFRSAAVEYLKSSEIGERITVTVQTQVESIGEKTDYTQIVNESVEKMGLPDFLTDSITKGVENVEVSKDNMVGTVSVNITDAMLEILATAALFLIVRIALAVIMSVLDKVCKLPVLNFMNKTAGAAVGVINALVVVYVLCALAMFFVPSENKQTVNDAIGETYITKHFYNNNLLLELLC